MFNTRGTPRDAYIIRSLPLYPSLPLVRDVLSAGYGDMQPAKIILLFGLVALLKLSAAAPDSAGIVEMVNGLAYGGIPYGSVSGMLAKYPGYGIQVNPPPFVRQLSGIQQQPIVITPNLRATRLVGFAPRPVQIYNLPGVIGPGVIGTISQISY